MKRRLYKSRNNRIVAGVCGGIAEYFNISPTIVRIGFILLSLLFRFSFSMVLIYAFLAVVIPYPPFDYTGGGFRSGGDDRQGFGDGAPGPFGQSGGSNQEPQEDEFEDIRKNADNVDDFKSTDDNSKE